MDRGMGWGLDEGSAWVKVVSMMEFQLKGVKDIGVTHNKKRRAACVNSTILTILILVVTTLEVLRFCYTFTSPI